MASDIDEAMQQAVRHHEAGRLKDAERIYRQVLEREPNRPGALHRLGMIALRAWRVDEAIDLTRLAIAADPRIAGFYLTLGTALCNKREFDEAIQCFQEALRLKPDFVEVLNNLGIALHEKGRYDEAINVYRQLLTLRPDYADAHNNLGNTLWKKQRLDEAQAAYRRALEVKPELTEAISSLCAILFTQRKYQEALEQYRKALSFRPGHALLHWYYALLLLSMGFWEEGWAEFEYRLQIPSFHLKRAFRQPQWDGSDPTGKTILLHAEGGFGDALNFIRFVSQLRRCGAKLILECQPELLSLFERFEGLDQVFARGQKLPDFDWQLPLQGLMHILKITPQNIPNKVPYLSAPPDLVEQWASRLAGESRLRVGLVWAGSRIRGSESRTRSIDVFAPFAAIPGVRFFSLQKGQESTQTPPQGMDLMDFSAELNDFADTAALLHHLDLVISVDTSVAHLAGAMGKAVWVLIPFQPEFRWLLDREDTPWYPSMRLFRQPATMDWNTPIEQIVKELKGLVSEKLRPE